VFYVIGRAKGSRKPAIARQRDHVGELGRLKGFGTPQREQRYQIVYEILPAQSVDLMNMQY